MPPLPHRGKDGSDNDGNEGVSGTLGETEDAEVTDTIPGLTSPHTGVVMGLCPTLGYSTLSTARLSAARR